MNKPILKSVPKDDPPRIQVDQKKRLVSLRSQLMRAAVSYVCDGKDGSRNDRLRTASSLSGIPINLIEVEAK